jgi:hypothetical protein
VTHPLNSWLLAVLRCPTHVTTREMEWEMLKLLMAVFGSAALWILFVAGTKPEEMIVGCACTLLTVAFSAYVAKTTSLEIRLRFGDVIQMWRIPKSLITGTWEILAVLIPDVLHIRPAESLFRAAPFESDSTAVWAARRVLAVAYTTATPNFIVIGIDPATKLMVFHQLRRSDVLTLTRRLGVQA